MSQTRDLLNQIELAKTDIDHADQLIRTYMPFIRSETAKFLHGPVQQASDDQFSIAMLAFHEAIRSYSALIPFLLFGFLTSKKARGIPLISVVISGRNSSEPFLYGSSVTT